MGGGTVVTIEELFGASVAVAETLMVVLLSRFKLLDGIDGSVKDQDLLSPVALFPIFSLTLIRYSLRWLNLGIL